MVIWREQDGNDLHIVQLMPLPPDHFLLHYKPDWFNLSAACRLLTQVVLEKRPLNGCLSVL